MKKFIVLISILFCFNSLLAQELEWLFGIGSTHEKASDRVSDIAVDTMGNIYVTGTFGDLADFNPSSAAYFLDALNNPNYNYHDLFLAKYSPSKSLIWAFRIGCVSNDNSGILAVDNMGNVFVSGDIVVNGYSSGDTLDFDPGPNTENILLTSNFSFLAKYDANGNFLWLNDTLRSVFMETDANRNLVIVSYSSSGHKVSKIDPNGNILWTQSLPTNIYNLMVEKDGDFLVTGTSSSPSIDLDPGVGTHMVNSINGFTHVSRFNNDGDFEDAFVLEWNSWSSYINPRGLKSTSNGDVILSGSFNGTSDFNPQAGVYNLSIIGQQSNTFMAKYDSLGILIWVKQIEGYNYSSKMGISDNDDIYILGDIYTSTVNDFDPGAGTFSLNSGESSYIAKYNTNGVFEWAGGFTGISTTFGLLALNVYKNGSVYIAGQFKNTTSTMVDFNPNPLNTHNLFCYGSHSQSDGDGFLLKLSPWVVGIKNEINNSVTQIYPNPTRDNLTINLDNYYQDIDLQLLSFSGQILKKQTFNNTNSISLNIENFPSGLYFIRLMMNDTITIRKIVRQ